MADNRTDAIDATYCAYDDHPIDGSDYWGDLATWRQAVACSR